MAATEMASQPFATQPWTLKPTGRSMFGQQTDSKKTTLPQYSFGAVASRDAQSKVFLSASHVEVDNKCRAGPAHVYNVPGALDRQVSSAKTTAPVYSFKHGPERLKSTPSEVPGPGKYESQSALGEQPLSPKRTLPQPRFGTGTRDVGDKLFLTNGHMDHSLKGVTGSPPGSYDPPAALGAQHASQRRTSPAFSVPRTERLKSRYEELSKTLPPVGAYETWSAIGKQTLSVSKTVPAYGFGSSSRGVEDKRFLTTGHSSHTLKGTASPNNYNHQTPQNLTAFGKQTLAMRQSVPSFGFGTSAKLPFKTSNVPGPGAYD